MGNTYELQNRLGVLFSFTLKLDLNETEHAPSIYPLKLHINERIYMLSGGGGNEDNMVWLHGGSLFQWKSMGHGALKGKERVMWVALITHIRVVEIFLFYKRQSANML